MLREVGMAIIVLPDETYSFVYLRKRFLRTDSSCCFSPSSGDYIHRALTAEPFFKVHGGFVNPGSSYVRHSLPLPGNMK